MQLFLLCVATLMLLIVVYYDWQDLHSLIRRKTVRPERSSNTPQPCWEPSVDIVIPVYNMAATLERTLRSVRQSNYPHKRIIVIDDGSDDGSTPAAIDHLSATIDIADTIVHAGKHAAANRGAELGDGEIILYLDADSYVTADFIEKTLQVLAMEGTDAVDFVQQVANPDAGFWPRMAAFEREILKFKPDNFGALFAIKRQTLERYPFKDCLSPQFDMNHHLLKQGKLSYAAAKVVFSDEPVKLTQVYRRKRRWAYGLLETLSGDNQTWDHHVWLPVLDLLLIGLSVLAPWQSIWLLFPLTLLLVWWLKALRLSRLIGFPAADACGYVIFMLVLCSAVTSAVFRFAVKSRVPWR